MKKYHGFGCKYLDTKIEKDCDCYLSGKDAKYEPTEQEMKARVIRTLIDIDATKKE